MALSHVMLCHVYVIVLCFTVYRRGAGVHTQNQARGRKGQVTYTCLWSPGSGRVTLGVDGGRGGTVWGWKSHLVPCRVARPGGLGVLGKHAPRRSLTHCFACVASEASRGVPSRSSLASHGAAAKEGAVITH